MSEILKYNRCRKVVNQKLSTSNLNSPAPNFGQKGKIGKIAATTETTDEAEELMDPKSAVFRPLWRYLCVFLVPGGRGTLVEQPNDRAMLQFSPFVRERN